MKKKKQKKYPDKKTNKQKPILSKTLSDIYFVFFFFS